MYKRVGPFCRRVLGLPALALMLLAWSPAQAQGQDAYSILRAMSDYLARQQAIEFSYDSAIEVITPQLEKIQFASSGSVRLRRPDGLWAHRTGGYTEVELFFDGEKVSVYDVIGNAYANFTGPKNLDELVEMLRQGHGVALPGADLLTSDSYEALTAGVQEAKYIGHGVVEGSVCEHLAFRNADTDWQLWVEVGEKPVPRKLVISSKTVAAAPQYSVTTRQWNTDEKPAPELFQFVPPSEATELSQDALIHLDELPQEVSP